MHGVCIPAYLAHGNSKGEARGKNRHKNNARAVRNLKKINLGMKEKQNLTSAKDLTIEHLERCESPTID